MLRGFAVDFARGIEVDFLVDFAPAREVVTGQGLKSNFSVDEQPLEQIFQTNGPSRPRGFQST